MKKTYILSAIIMLVLVGQLNSQNPINRKVFSINAWFIANANSNPAASLGGKWKLIADAGITHVRLGGIAANWIPLYTWGTGFSVNPGTFGVPDGDVAKLKELIDSCRKYGMEPIIEVGYAPPNTCSNGALSGISVNDAATIAANVVDAINNTLYTAASGPMKKIDNWIIANEPDLTVTCPPPAGKFGGFSWNNDGLGHADSIANYIKVFSKAMKSKDPSIKIIGPEISAFSAWTGWDQNKMMKKMVTTTDSACLTGKIVGGPANGQWLLDETTFHHYPVVASRSVAINNPTDINDGNALRAKLISNAGVNKGIIPHINSGGSGRTAADLLVGVTEYNIGNTSGIDESTNYAGMIQGNDFRSFIGGQWLSLTLAEAMNNPWSGHYCLWSAAESDTNACKAGFGFISTCTGNKRPTYYHMAMTSHLAGNFYYATSVNGANVKSFAGVEPGAGFHIMVLNMDSTTTYPTTQISFSNTATAGALNINYGFAGVLTPTVIPSYTDSVPIQARSTVIYEFDCHGKFVTRVDYTEQMAITNTAPQLKKVGNTTINPNVLAMGANPISGNINNTTTFLNDTVYINGNLNIVGNNTKLTFKNCLVVVRAGKTINSNPNTSLEVNNSIIIGENGGSWGGITANSNYHPGLAILIDKSVLINADNALSTDKLSEVQVTQSILASASGQKAIFMDRGQKFTVDNNLIVGYKAGVSTSRTAPNFISKITNNQFLGMDKVLQMVNDNHTSLEITCNLFKGFNRGLDATGTTLNDQGSATLSAGNVFLQSGAQQDYVLVSGSSPKYYFGPSQSTQFSLPNIVNIPIVQSTADRVCAQLFSSNCPGTISYPIGIKENAIDKNGFVVYPNPSSGAFTVKWSDLPKGNWTLNVHDVLGRIITSKKIDNNSDNTTLQINTKGIYFVTLQNGSDRITQKVIVE